MNVTKLFDGSTSRIKILKIRNILLSVVMIVGTNFTTLTSAETVAPRTQEQLNADLMAAVDSGKGIQKAMDALSANTLEKAKKAGLKGDDLKKLEELLKRIGGWTRDVEEKGLDGDERGSPAAFPQFIAPGSDVAWFPPNNTSSDDTSTSGSINSANNDEQMKAFMSLFAAAVCVAQPPACAVMMPLMMSLGSGGEYTTAVETMKGIQDAATTGEIDPKLQEQLKRQLENLSKEHLGKDFYDAVRRLPAELDKAPREAALLDLLNQSFRGSKIEEDLTGHLPAWAREVLDQLKNGVSTEDLCELLPADGDGPFFTNAIQKSTMQFALSLAGQSTSRSPLYKKYWTNFLSKVDLQDDPNRGTSNPCQL